ncbi:MAG TPA: M23 family metallopeptidase [Haloplasmataceae bacterium]
MKGRIMLFSLIIFLILGLFITKTNALDTEYQERMALYQEYALLTDIPWYIIGAIDQYERNTKSYRSYCPKEKEVISICFHPQLWSGSVNPNQEERDLNRIKNYHGIGADGDNDGYADRLNKRDRLVTMLNYINLYGVTNEKIEEALLNYYQNEQGVKIIKEIASIFKHYNRIDLDKRVHPIPKGFEASVVSNYGQGRSFGGPRTHEGLDIFAHYGTPVVSTAYGIVEIKGWNRLGGYRIGIRDIYNTYEFYAHLSSYAKGIEEGTIVKPGQVIGYVGSTGYGKEGTSGRFPPHLHFGLYKFDGNKEWSFNPYPYLRKWERVRL